MCPVCFEEVNHQSKEEIARVGAESCSLDCGHELHAVSGIDKGERLTCNNLD